jgi:hypothetical protein
MIVEASGKQQPVRVGQLGRRRAQLVTAATAAVLRVRDFLPVAWPSAVTAAGGPFQSMTWLAAVEAATSRCGGDPARLAAAGEEESLALVRDAAPGWGTPRPGRRIARKVLALADDPGPRQVQVGLPEHDPSDGRSAA